MPTVAQCEAVIKKLQPVELYLHKHPDVLDDKGVRGIEYKVGSHSSAENLLQRITRMFAVHEKNEQGKFLHKIGERITTSL